LSKDILRREINIAPKISENEIDLKKLSGLFKDVLAKSLEIYNGILQK